MKTKFETLMHAEGYSDAVEFIEQECMGFGMRAGVPAICMNPHCEYCIDMEPDQDEGWCEMCETNTVCSALVLYGII